MAGAYLAAKEMHMQMHRSMAFRLFSVVLLASCTGGLALADRAYWEKVLPKENSAVGEYTFVVYQFSRGGRYLTNNKKYAWVSTTFRSTAINNAVDWEKAGMGVHVLWWKGKKPSDADIERAVAKNYEENYGKKDVKRPPNDTPSLGGTVWRDSNLDYYWFSANGQVESGDSQKGIASNDRGTWKQAGNKVTITLRGASETWTIDGMKMTYGLRTMTRLK
jgi:hypothetical protein